MKVKTMTKAVLFDLDGTILNTTLDLNDAVNYALLVNNFNEITLEETIKYTGNGIKKLMERAIPGGKDNVLFPKAFNDFKEYYNIHCLDKTTAYPEMAHTLSILKERGYLLAVVSNKADFLTKKIVAHYYPNTFDYVIGARENMNLKPAADLPQFVLQELKVEKENAFYIGDTDVDFETAVNTGLKPIIVTYGFRSKAFLIKKGITVFSNSPIGLLDYLK